MPKQTAVEWLVEQLPLIQQEGLRDIFEQAKQMHKEEIVNAVDGFPLDKRHLDGEDYYQETYGGQDE
jgi:hypothetical protein